MILYVVICFHFTIFVVLETTEDNHTMHADRLWFAFILLSLSYWKQLGRANTIGLTSCDLLSFYYLCRTGNNHPFCGRTRRYVVICFHFTIFVVLETTITWDKGSAQGLWFAFILLSLSYWKQQKDALELAMIVVICFHFTIFVVLETTEESNLRRHHLVVICFHFTIFVVLETTPWRNCPPPSWLWFAFILLSLSYWKQLTLVIEGCTIGCDLLSFYYLCRTGNNAPSDIPW